MTAIAPNPSDCCSTCYCNCRFHTINVTITGFRDSDCRDGDGIGIEFFHSKYNRAFAVPFPEGRLVFADPWYEKRGITMARQTTPTHQYEVDLTMVSLGIGCESCVDQPTKKVWHAGFSTNAECATWVRLRDEEGWGEWHLYHFGSFITYGCPPSPLNPWYPSDECCQTDCNCIAHMGDPTGTAAAIECDYETIYGPVTAIAKISGSEDDCPP